MVTAATRCTGVSSSRRFFRSSRVSARIEKLPTDQVVCPPFGSRSSRLKHHASALQPKPFMSLPLRQLTAPLVLTGLMPLAAFAQDTRATLVAEVPGNAVFVVPEPDDPSTLLVGEQAGLINRVRLGQVDGTFLDLTAEVSPSALGGLLSLVFHPDYENNGWVYVMYQASGQSSRLARYTVPVPSILEADPATELVLRDFIGPIAFHWGGALEFGPDGKLYVGVGDPRVELDTEGCTAQDLSRYEGKILRLEDDGSIPPDNPYVGVAGALPGIYARGLRQPFRLSFDSLTGGVFIGDVGEVDREEVNYVPPGLFEEANFEWQTLEGTLLTGSTLCPTDPSQLVGNRISPLFEYDHLLGCSVTGGLVVRDAGLPGLEGSYLFSDWCGGMTWALDVDFATGALIASTEIQANLDPPGPLRVDAPTSYSQASDGQIFFSDMFSLQPNVSEVFRLRTDDPLVSDREFLSSLAGGTQHFELDAGPAMGGQLYLLVGTLSGSDPGISVDGLNLPINFDAYTQFTLGGGAGLYTNSVGLLDADGFAEAQFTLPPGTAPQAVGSVFHHAFVTIDPLLSAVTFVSNAEVTLLRP